MASIALWIGLLGSQEGPLVEMPVYEWGLLSCRIRIEYIRGRLGVPDIMDKMWEYLLWWLDDLRRKGENDPC